DINLSLSCVFSLSNKISPDKIILFLRLFLCIFFILLYLNIWELTFASSLTKLLVHSFLLKCLFVVSFSSFSILRFLYIVNPITVKIKIPIIYSYFISYYNITTLVFIGQT